MDISANMARHLLQVLLIFAINDIINVAIEAVPCRVRYDDDKCFAELTCMKFFEIGGNFEILRNRHSSNCDPPIYFNGNSGDPIYLKIRDNNVHDSSEIIPTITRDYYNNIDFYFPFIHSLDISYNSYGYTPIIREMSHLVNLNMSHNEITIALLSNQYQLESLQDLDLAYNTITDLQVKQNDGDFPYTKLKRLDLSHNYLVSIPDAVFDNFDNLKTLDMSYNYIDSFSQLTFEGIKKLVYLNLSSNRIFDINTSLFRFTELKELDLSLNRIVKIKYKDFETLKHLEVLKLQFNSIATIDYNAFFALTQLQRIDLSNNQLRALDNTIFINSHFLNNVNLDNNKLMKLPVGLFKNNSIHEFSITDNQLEGELLRGMFRGLDVSILDLNNQSISSVNDYVFENNIALETLLLNNNKIQSLSNWCFKGLLNLKHLDLSNNKVSSIHFVIQDLVNLETLSLSNNQITKIEQGTLQDLVTLLYLDLSKNAITTLESNCFESLRDLINLRLTNNPISGTLESNTFQGLVSLPSLDVSQNMLMGVHNLSFDGMVELKQLNMSHNKISLLQYNVFSHTGSIDVLDLSYNKLEDFLVNSTEIESLSVLILNNNFLKLISDSTFQGLSHLVTLDLSYNYIQRIENGSFVGQTELHSLNLSMNSNLTFNVDIIEKNDKLNILNISGIRSDMNFQMGKINTELFITQLIITDAYITNITYLKLNSLYHVNELLLSHNSVTILEDKDFFNMSLLKHLDLSYNNISVIPPNIFKTNGHLNTLNLSHNFLIALPYGIFRGLIYLQTLDISYNYIKQLNNERLYEAKGLAYLIADNNKIEDIDPEVFEGTSLETLSIGNNPIPCEKLVKFKKAEDMSSFHITAIHMNEHVRENVDGINCGAVNTEKRRYEFNYTNSDNILIDIKHLLENFISKDKEEVKVEQTNDIMNHLPNLTNAVTQLNFDNNYRNQMLFDKLSELTNITKDYIRIKENETNDQHFSTFTTKILKQLNNTNINLLNMFKLLSLSQSSTTTSLPLSDDKKSAVDLLPYMNKMRSDLEHLLAIEKQNIWKELNDKISNVNTRNMSALSKDLKNTNDDSTRFLFTEICVALILLILVALVLYKFYKAKILSKQFSLSTRELSGAIDNSTL